MGSAYWTRRMGGTEEGEAHTGAGVDEEGREMVWARD